VKHISPIVNLIVNICSSVSLLPFISVNKGFDLIEKVKVTRPLYSPREAGAAVTENVLGVGNYCYGMLRLLAAARQALGAPKPSATPCAHINRRKH